MKYESQNPINTIVFNELQYIQPPIEHLKKTHEFSSHF